MESFADIPKLGITMPGSAHVPLSRNKDVGFYGTVKNADPNSLAALLWRLEIQYIVDTVGLKPEEARDFLDSQEGRFWAEMVVDGRATPKYLEKAVGRWRPTYDPADYGG